MNTDGEEERLSATLAGSKEKQLKDFLRCEFDRNEDLKRHFLIYMTGESKRGGKSVDGYKKEVTQHYQEASGRHGMLDYGVELDFSSFQDLAERYIEKGNYIEAAKVYQAISEAITENMDMVDDSDGYYGGEFDSAMEGLASVIHQASFNHEDKARYIKYLFDKYVANDDDFEENYEDALKSICTTREDLLYWKGLLAPGLPSAIPDFQKDWTRYYEAERSLLMQAYILDRLGDEQSIAELYNLFRKNYRDDREFCLLYVNRLDKDGKRDEAVRTAEEGLGIFQPHLTLELRHFLEGFYERSNPEKHRENLKNIFFEEGDWAYYEKLRKACGSDWGNMLNEMISHFTPRDGRYENGGKVIDIYLREKMYADAISLVLGRRSLPTLDHYYDQLSTKYPNEYFQAYKELIIPYAESRMGREHYRSVVSELSRMKRIKGFQTQFEQVVRELKERHAKKPAFLDELRKI